MKTESEAEVTGDLDQSGLCGMGEAKRQKWV